jgi:hypothetical protein
VEPLGSAACHWFVISGVATDRAGRTPRKSRRARTEDGARNPLGSVALHRWRHVRVDLPRHVSARVVEPFADDLDVDALVQRKATRARWRPRTSPGIGTVVGPRA